MQINLNGLWKVTDDLGVQSKAGKPGFEPAGWRDIAVPGHWQQAPGLERYTGRLLYRKSFQFDRTLAPGEAARLRFDGIFYEAKIWFNGAFIGEQKGCFIPELYDVTKHFRQGENVVLVEVEAPKEENPNNKKMIAGLFTDWECKPPEAEPGGIWRDVVLEVYHGVVPEKFLLQAAPDGLPALMEGPVTATVSFELEFSCVAEGALSWTATIAPETFPGEPLTLSGSQPVRRGWNRLHSAASLLDPRLWWTWDHGAPDLYRLTLSLTYEGGPPVQIVRLFGVRKIEMRKWHFYLNGRRIFVRGTNYGPPDIRLATVKRESYQRDLDLMIGANMNMVRVQAHVGKPELYEEASRKGILVWQDFPLHGLYSRAVMDDAKRQARAMVELLGHWPAIAVWCGHNDPSREANPEDYSAFSQSVALLSLFAGNWNRSGLAPALKDVIQKADPTRPCISASGDFGVIRGGTDTHHYWGWYVGKAEDLQKMLRTFPDTARFVSEFGAQAFPNIENSRKFVRGTWPNINWSDLSEKHMLQPKIMERHVPHSTVRTFEEYVEATQRYQAHLHKYFIERLRRIKYEPCGGVLQFLFGDSAPGVTWSIVDYWRQPKAAYQAVKEAFRPLMIMADWPQLAYAPGARLALGVYMVNDRHQNYRGTWTWAIEREGQTIAADTKPAYLQPDGVAGVPAGVEWTVPPGLEPGPVALVLTLSFEGMEPVVNRYGFNLLPAPGQ